MLELPSTQPPFPFFIAVLLLMTALDRYMAPTAPAGVPSVAIVFARLISGGEDCGIRSFLVDISDGRLTYPGITVR